MATDPPAEPGSITVVGPGRLGTAVATRLRAAGWQVRLVGRGAPLEPAALSWLTVPDRAVTEVARALPVGGVVLHAAGALDRAALAPHLRAGSLHPLMSFARGAEPSPGERVPAAVEGHPDAAAAATRLARALGWEPFAVPGDRRLYHAAAVLAGNFATALLAEAARVLAAAGVPAADAPALLAPLALRSLQNAAALGPAAALTGPVARGDTAVVDAHLAALDERDPAAAQVYRALLDAARRLRQPVT